MNRNRVEAIVRQSAYEHIGCGFIGYNSPDDMDLSLSLMEDLQADSLDFIEFCMACEERLSKEVPDEIAEKFETLLDVVNYFDGSGT